MPWIQLSINIEQKDAEKLEAVLFEHQACSVTYMDAGNQPILEPMPGETPLWDHMVVLALYTFDQDIKRIKMAIAVDMGWTTWPEHQIEEIKDQDWERAWMDDFKPMQFGKKLWVCPSNQPIPDQNAINLLLDPGLAFGTGTHPTTSLCLQWLDKYIKGGETIIDYGCGSGVLALAALKLGAKYVYCVDIDPLALTATQDNMTKNDIDSSRYDCFLPENAPKAMSSDILLANILANPLIELAPKFRQMVTENGFIALSGILKEQQAQVLNAYSPYFSDLEVSTQGDWVSICSTIKN